MRRLHIISLGCPKNQVDSERMASIATSAGWELVADLESADLILLNTCGFIQSARSESIEEILQALELKRPDARVAVTGCLFKRYPDELPEGIPEVDAWIGLKDFAAWSRLLAADPEASPDRLLLNPSHYAYLRIADGCDNRCSYCAIPDIRGHLRSEPVESLLEEAARLAVGGVKELIITAQDITRYGVDRTGKPQLVPLVHRLHEIPGIQWIRLMYLHPARLTDEILEMVRDLPRVCPYLDIPIQHIDDHLLKSMNRGIGEDDLRRLLDRVRKTVPGVALRTSLISGYPGESRGAYIKLRRFVKEARFDKLGVFPYSPEEGTPAFALPDVVPMRTAHRRMDTIMRLQAEISEELLQNRIGSMVPVIVEEELEDEEVQWVGRTVWDAPDIDGVIYLQGDCLRIGEIVMAEVLDSDEYDLWGRILRR